MKELKHFSGEASEILSLDPTLCLEVNNFIWKHIRRLSQDLDYESFYLKNLGTLSISKYKLYREIQSEIKRIRNFRLTDKFTPERKEREVNKRLTRLRLLLKKRNEIAIWANSQNILS